MQIALYCEGVRNSLGHWIRLSSNKKANRLDQLIVYAGIEMEPFSEKDIVNLLQKHKCFFSTEEIIESFARLELSYILEKQKKFTFRVPIFRNMIKEMESEKMLVTEMSNI